MTLYRLKKFDWTERPGGVWRATVPILAIILPPSAASEKWCVFTAGESVDEGDIPNCNSAAEAIAAVERVHYAGIMDSLEPVEVTP